MLKASLHELRAINSDEVAILQKKVLQLQTENETLKVVIREKDDRDYKALERKYNQLLHKHATLQDLYDSLKQKYSILEQENQALKVRFFPMCLFVSIH